MPDGEEGHSKWGSAPAEASLSGLQLGMDMAAGAGGGGGGAWLSWEPAWLKERTIRGLQTCRQAGKTTDGNRPIGKVNRSKPAAMSTGCLTARAP